MKLMSMMAWIGISVLSSYSSAAQISSHISWADSLFQHLDKSVISTGVLYDRVYGLAELQDYMSTDTTDGDRLKQAYFELYNAAYNKTSWLKPEHFAYLTEVENFHLAVAHFHCFVP